MYCLLMRLGRIQIKKSDGRVGGQKFVVPVGNNCCAGRVGATTDIHFTLLCFTSATGAPVMCALIFRSEKEVSELPTNWKMGIDVTKAVHTDDDDAEMFLQNWGDDKTLAGGPKCYYKGKLIPCFVGASPN
jgi:hypothetical protein